MRFMSIFAGLLGMLAAPAVHAQDMCPGNMEPTIAALTDCVMHGAATGAIDTYGVAASLLAKLGAAQAASQREQPGVAVLQIEAFVNEVQAVAGLHIDPGHAAHMIAHAQLVIAALGG